jgi:hypothetical protein
MQSNSNLGALVLVCVLTLCELARIRQSGICSVIHNPGFHGA